MKLLSGKTVLALVFLFCSTALYAVEGSKQKDDPGIATVVKSLFDAVAGNNIENYKKLILTADDVQALLQKTFDYAKSLHTTGSKKTRNMAAERRYYRIDHKLKHILSQKNDPYYLMSLIKYHRIIDGFTQIRMRAEKAGLKWSDVQFQKYVVSSNRVRRGVSQARVYIYLASGGKLYRIYIRRLMKRRDGSWAIGGSVRWYGEVKPKSYLPK